MLQANSIYFSRPWKLKRRRLGGLAGYPLQVLARSSLWAFRFYPCRDAKVTKNQ